MNEPTTRARALGAIPIDAGSTLFRVWAPQPDEVVLKLLGPVRREVPMQRDGRAYRTARVEGVGPGQHYVYRLPNGDDRPDPASRFQPEGVHGPSEVVSPDFDWSDHAWLNPPLNRHVIYELHVGTFTPEGTFDAVIGRLDDLKDLGVTMIELMPVAQFPGTRNWGYDGVCLYAAQNSYGGPAGLKRLVNACHARGLAVCLDVVYNHLGPEGNYLRDFGPYFTDRHHTPWGDAVNLDDAGSDHVREFFIQNALYWVRDCHVDALRLDAVHAIVDTTPTTFIEQLAAEVHAEAGRLGRRVQVIAESSDNDPRLIRPRELGGYGLDGVWSDDFHHVVHTLLTGERDGYYIDYGRPEQLAKALREGFVYTGQHSPFRNRRHGRAAPGSPPERFVVCIQNHDQVGNRMLGERLGDLTDPGSCRLAAAMMILSPFTPLLFMGEEYAEPAPFQYFVSHSDPGLVEAVRKGRAEEFRGFHRGSEAPDPQSEQTFSRSRPDWGLRGREPHAAMLAFYKELLRLRREWLAGDPDETAVQFAAPDLLILRRRWPGRGLLCVFNVADEARRALWPRLCGGADGAPWSRLLDSDQRRWGGAGPAGPEDPRTTEPINFARRSAVVYGSQR